METLRSGSGAPSWPAPPPPASCCLHVPEVESEASGTQRSLSLFGPKDSGIWNSNHVPRLSQIIRPSVQRRPLRLQASVVQPYLRPGVGRTSGSGIHPCRVSSTCRAGHSWRRKRAGCLCFRGEPLVPWPRAALGAGGEGRRAGGPAGLSRRGRRKLALQTQ